MKMPKVFKSGMVFKIVKHSILVGNYSILVGNYGGLSIGDLIVFVRDGDGGNDIYI